MSTCCDTPMLPGKRQPEECPVSQTKGRPVELITLKALLKPPALERLDPQKTYRFCPTDTCEVVYFTPEGDTFTKSDLKVPVFQKDPGADVPACYCFGWTRKRIGDEIASTGNSTAEASITQNIKAGRCGCEVNNPQGSCCLGNVNQVVKDKKKTIAYA